MLSLRMMKMPTFARFPEVRSHSNHKVYYMLKCYSLALVSEKLHLLLKMKILFAEYAQLSSPHLNMYVTATNELLSAY